MLGDVPELDQLDAGAQPAPIALAWVYLPDRAPVATRSQILQWVAELELPSGVMGQPSIPSITRQVVADIEHRYAAGHELRVLRVATDGHDSAGLFQRDLRSYVPGEQHHSSRAGVRVGQLRITYSTSRDEPPTHRVKFVIGSRLNETDRTAAREFATAFQAAFAVAIETPPMNNLRRLIRQCLEVAGVPARKHQPLFYVYEDAMPLLARVAVLMERLGTGAELFSVYLRNDPAERAVMALAADHWLTEQYVSAETSINIQIQGSMNRTRLVLLQATLDRLDQQLLAHRSRLHQTLPQATELARSCREKVSRLTG